MQIQSRVNFEIFLKTNNSQSAKDFKIKNLFIVRNLIGKTIQLLFT